MSRITDAIQAADAKLIAQHQKVADWAYTRWDVSPYWIAAQLFGVLALLRILSCGERYANGAESIGHTMFLGLMGIAIGAYWFYAAMRTDANWKNGRLPEAWTFYLLFYFRGMSAVFLIPDLILAVLAISLDVYSFSAALWHVRDFAEFAAFYFLSCSAPTKILRRQQELVPLPTTS